MFHFTRDCKRPTRRGLREATDCVSRISNDYGVVRSRAQYRYVRTARCQAGCEAMHGLFSSPYKGGSTGRKMPEIEENVHRKVRWSTLATRAWCTADGTQERTSQSQATC